jgi:hypothetical protein
MPMVGHIAETGQIVSCDFRQGNAAQAKENFEFIQQCQRALPNGCTVGALRIDAAGYQARIIQYCDEQQIDYAIRAKMSSSIRQHLSQLSEADWQPLIKRNGEPSTYYSTHRMPHCIGDYERAFDLVIQRHPIRQSVLDLDEDTDSQAIVQKDLYTAQLPPTAAHCAIERSSIGTTSGLKIVKTALRNLNWILVATPCPVLILTPTPGTFTLMHCLTIYSP